MSRDCRDKYAAKHHVFVVCTRRQHMQHMHAHLCLAALRQQVRIGHGTMRPSETSCPPYPPLPETFSPLARGTGAHMCGLWFRGLPLRGAFRARQLSILTIAIRMDSTLLAPAPLQLPSHSHMQTPPTLLDVPPPPPPETCCRRWVHSHWRATESAARSIWCPPDNYAEISYLPSPAAVALALRSIPRNQLADSQMPSRTRRSTQAEVGSSTEEEGRKKNKA